MAVRQIFSHELIEANVRQQIKKVEAEKAETPKDDIRMHLALKGEIRGLRFALDLLVHSRTAARGY